MSENEWTEEAIQKVKNTNQRNHEKWIIKVSNTNYCIKNGDENKSKHWHIERIKIDNLVKPTYESVKTQDILSEIWKEIKLIMVNFFFLLPIITVLSFASGKSRFFIWRLKPSRVETWFPCISLREWPCDQLADAPGVVNKRAGRWESREPKGQVLGSRCSP